MSEMTIGEIAREQPETGNRPARPGIGKGHDMGRASQGSLYAVASPRLEAEAGRVIRGLTRAAMVTLAVALPTGGKLVRVGNRGRQGRCRDNPDPRNGLEAFHDLVVARPRLKILFKTPDPHLQITQLLRQGKDHLDRQRRNVRHRANHAIPQIL